MSGPYREPAEMKKSLFTVDFEVKMASGETHKYSVVGCIEGNVRHVVEYQLRKFVELPQSFGTGNSQAFSCYRGNGIRDAVIIVDKHFNGLVIKLAQVETFSYTVVNEDGETRCFEANPQLFPRKNRKIITEGLR